MNPESRDMAIEIDDEWIAVSWRPSLAEESESLYGSYEFRFTYTNISRDAVLLILRDLEVPPAHVDAVMKRLGARQDASAPIHA